MPSESSSADYKSDRPPHRTVAGGGHASVEGPSWRPADWALIEDFFQLLARAVRQFRTYPAASPLCTDAITACHKAFVSFEGRQRIECRVAPHELIIDEAGVGAGTIVEHELIRRLHHAHIAAVDIDCAASSRDLARFCSDVARCAELAKTKTTLAELLVEHGVDTIVPRMARRPEVLDLGAPRAPLCNLVEHERGRRSSAPAEGPARHLYPPDKGWVRLDPATPFDTISLVDLAVLVDDPHELATMLLRLTDDDPVGREAEAAALEQKFGDVATLFGSLDPRLARVMFVKLSRAVLALEPDHRKGLLQRTILPGLLDGRAAGSVLRDFPDFDLAESLCLLLDLETAAPEVLMTALDRLDLPAEQRQRVVPLLEARLRGGPRAQQLQDPEQEQSVDRYARRLIHVDANAGKSFAEFAAFDLSMDDHAAAAIGRLREAIGVTDVPASQLPFLWSLVRLEPNPTLVDAFLRRTLGLFVELERSARWQDLAFWASRFQQLANTLAEPRPDVADAISKTLSAFCTPDRAMVLVDLSGAGEEQRAVANAVVDAFGSAFAPAFVGLLDDPAQQPRTRAILLLMCDHAPRIAPGLVAGAGQRGIAATRATAKVLGFAGAGYEQALADMLGCSDEQTGREAFRALAHIGSAQAAAIVAGHLRQGVRWARGAAEEALWHFPPAQTAVLLRELLGCREFVLQHPDIASRLIDRAMQAKTTGLQRELGDLAPLRFRFWNPGLVRVALKAQELSRR